ncbi:hypothetical protein JRO89_XS05G0165700 [Xanthoceras sorbifolium]|uniref:Uncharacterized protein n=1 Tax=Xanthoceras sorbifolium TaxID=99658 RepID=A0ABQ8I2A1_9ROSI|nr:hypothetical protein JRO89_XS05G0165700 [Xanthoceras sorbifolium]
MAEEGKADSQLFNLLSNLLQQVSFCLPYYMPLTAFDCEFVEFSLSSVGSIDSTQLDELEIARELDKLSAKLDDVDDMISTAIATDPQVQSLLSGTAEVWMPVITATADERRNFTGSIGDNTTEEKSSS